MSEPEITSLGTPNIFTNRTTQSEFRRYFIEKKGFVFFVGFFVSTIILFFAIVDPKFLTSRTIIYAVLIILPFVVGFYTVSKVSVSTTTMKMFGAGFLLLLVLGGSIYILQKLQLNSVLMHYIFYIIFFFILTIGLSITYIIFSNAIKRQQGAAGFWIRLIFFIPCLLNDFFEYIRGEFKITPPIIVWLLVLELLLLILQAYMPRIIRYFTFNPKNSLMAFPVYLSDEHIIATSDRFLMTSLNNSNKYADGNMKPAQTTVTSKKNSIEFLNATFRNANYAFSFWTYVNPGSISKSPYVDGKTNIFTYGTFSDSALSENAKPQITYANNVMIVYFAGSGSPPLTVEVPVQMWLHVVVNYGSDHADLYINGTLKHKYSYSSGTPPSGKAEDTVTVGQNQGLDGAIRDVRYFENYLTPTQITELYNVGYTNVYKTENPRISAN